MSILLHVTYPGPILHTREYSKIHFSSRLNTKDRSSMFNCTITKKFRKGSYCSKPTFQAPLDVSSVACNSTGLHCATG